MIIVHYKKNKNNQKDNLYIKDQILHICTWWEERRWSETWARPADTILFPATRRRQSLLSLFTAHV